MISRSIFLVTSALALLSAAAAAANETISYGYDARGRLVTAARSGGPNNALTTSYTLDKADNRTTKFTGTGGGSGGILASAGEVPFTPFAQTGNKVGTFTVQDSLGATAQATLSVHVTAGTGQ